MKHLLIILSLLFIPSLLSATNSFVGKGAICDGHNLKYFYYFHKEDKYQQYVFKNNKLIKNIYNYEFNLDEITLHYYVIKRKTLVHRGISNFTNYGVCDVYSSFESFSEAIKNYIEKSKSENLL